MQREPAVALSADAASFEDERICRLRHMETTDMEGRGNNTHRYDEIMSVACHCDFASPHGISVHNSLA